MCQKRKPRFLAGPVLETEGSLIEEASHKEDAEGDAE